MRRDKIVDGMVAHYTSIIGRGPSVKVTIASEPHKTGRGKGSWRVSVRMPNGRVVSVSTDALYAREVKSGVDKRSSKTQRETDAVLNNLSRTEKMAMIDSAIRKLSNDVRELETMFNNLQRGQ